MLLTRPETTDLVHSILWLDPIHLNTFTMFHYAWTKSIILFLWLINIWSRSHRDWLNAFFDCPIGCVWLYSSLSANERSKAQFLGITFQIFSLSWATACNAIRFTRQNVYIRRKKSWFSIFFSRVFLSSHCDQIQRQLGSAPLNSLVSYTEYKFLTPVGCETQVGEKSQDRLDESLYLRWK